MKKENITLIGMPGSGKSTIGVILAKALGYEFIDTDLLIQKQEGRLLREIIAEEGLARFMEIENQVNAGVTGQRAVIAPGGSVVYGEEAMKHLSEISTVVYLKLSYKTIAGRIQDTVKRGVVLKNGQTLQDLYEERCPLYERYADITIDAEQEDAGVVMDLILERRKGF
ncbi:MAG: shikimate kinase [Lachnospiraceae bacterium]|jgi:shikimate kinase|nr:shikimate kinase [Lachnospiraceae bacterium]MCX4317070.1 shikimate kinase [Lachnospiraceae bacterium]